MTDTIESLRTRIAELDAENARLIIAIADHQTKRSEYCQQLAESQARESQLRSYLEKIGEIASPYRDGVKFNYIADISQEALSIPSDDTALREYGANLVERYFWAMGGNGSVKHMEIQNKIRKGEF